jgi:hypothetical protein
MSAPAAQEGPFPMMTGAPPNAQPMDLAQAFATVDSLIWRDGGMDDQEMQIFSAWVQQTMMKIQAQEQQQAMQQGGMAGAAQQAGAGSTSSPVDSNPFGGAGATDLYSGSESDRGGY